MMSHIVMLLSRFFCQGWVWRTSQTGRKAANAFGSMTVKTVEK